MKNILSDEDYVQEMEVKKDAELLLLQQKYSSLPFEIRWDEDYDTRIYKFIDLHLPAYIWDSISWVGEHEGVVTICWRRKYDYDQKNWWYHYHRPHGGLKIYGDWWSYDDEIEKNEEDEPLIPVSRIISQDSRYIIIKRQRWRCNFCTVPLKFDMNSKWDGEVAHIDHIHPFSKKNAYENGEQRINEPSNLQALCPNCNLRKNKKEIN